MIPHDQKNRFSPFSSLSMSFHPFHLSVFFVEPEQHPEVRPKAHGMTWLKSAQYVLAQMLGAMLAGAGIAEPVAPFFWAIQRGRWGGPEEVLGGLWMARWWPRGGQDGDQGQGEGIGFELSISPERIALPLKIQCCHTFFTLQKRTSPTSHWNLPHKVCRTSSVWVKEIPSFHSLSQIWRTS